jgi:uncharacterized membrane protein
MAALIWLPRALLGGLSIATIALHNFADSIRPADLGGLAPLWHFLHVPGFAIPGTLLIAYPLVPWVAVMALGFVLADVYTWDAARRRRLLVWTGVVTTLLFLALRALNGYGNPQPWGAQRTSALTVASFLNVTKYPPSLLFLLMTLGPSILALPLLERARGRLAGLVEVFGRVPLFYYLLHIPLIHLLALALAYGVIARIALRRFA